MKIQYLAIFALCLLTTTSLCKNLAKTPHFTVKDKNVSEAVEQKIFAQSASITKSGEDMTDAIKNSCVFDFGTAKYEEVELSDPKGELSSD
jgi:hypothetical protein